MSMEIISETPISASELKTELEKIKKRNKELNFRAAKTDEHLASVNVMKQADELYEKILKMDIPRLKEQHIKKIVDIMPTSIKDIKAVLQGYNTNVSAENLKKIVDAVVASKK